MVRKNTGIRRQPDRDKQVTVGTKRATKHKPKVSVPSSERTAVGASRALHTHYTAASSSTATRDNRGSATAARPTYQ